MLERFCDTVDIARKPYHAYMFESVKDIANDKLTDLWYRLFHGSFFKGFKWAILDSLTMLHDGLTLSLYEKSERAWRRGREILAVLKEEVNK